MPRVQAFEPVDSASQAATIDRTAAGRGGNLCCGYEEQVNESRGTRRLREFPAKEISQELNIAFAQGDVDFILEHVTDDIVWRIIGERRLEGGEVFRGHLIECRDLKVNRLTIHRIITHGREAAVSGEMRLEGGDAFGFCDVYVFASFKGNRIGRLDSYVLRV